MRRGVEYSVYRIAVLVLLHIPHLITQLTLNYLLGTMAGRHGGQRENAGRRSNQEIGNAANPTGNFMDRWLRGEESKEQEEEEEQNANELTEEQQRHVDEQEQAAKNARHEAAAARERDEKTAKIRNDAIKHLQKLAELVNDKNYFVDLKEPDNDINYYNEDEILATEDEPHKRRSAKYKPSPTSAIWLHLQKTQKLIAERKVHCSIVTNMTKGIHWVAPQTPDPVASGTCQPDAWYLHNLWMYLWLPFTQYSFLDIKAIACPHCDVKGKLESKQHDWRPMIGLDKITWVMHRRVLCGACSKSIAEIDPRFLSRLPTRVAERSRFEFVTTVSGPGMHRSLVYKLVSLVDNAVMFGTFQDIINGLHALWYTMNHVSQLDSLHDLNRKSGMEMLENVGFFSHQYDTKGYCGVRVSKALVKSVFESFMLSHEPYMQAYFQTCSDEGASKDETFKYANVIKLSGRKGKVFTASTTLLSQSGLITMNRLRYTKAHEEIRPSLEQWRDCRANAGVGDLLRVETDNPDADRREWERIFPSLLKDVTPYQPRQINLPTATITQDNIVIVASNAEANTVATALIQWRNDQDHQGEAAVFAGIDAEWNQKFDGTVDITRTLQVSLPTFPVYVFHLSEMGVKEPLDFPTTLKLLLEDLWLRACGCNIGQDLARLSDLGVNMKYRLELVQLGNLVEPNVPCGLADLAERYMGVFVDKSHRLDDWSQFPLPTVQEIYAALDALLSRILAVLMYKMGLSREILTHQAPEKLQEGSEVNLFMFGKDAAKGVVDTIGGQLGMIGKGVAIIWLMNVLVPGTRPPFDFKHPTNPQQSWFRKDVSLGDLFNGHEQGTATGPQIAIRTSSLRVFVAVDDDASPLEELVQLDTGPREMLVTRNAEGDDEDTRTLLAIPRNAEADNEDTRPLLVLQNTEDDDEDTTPRNTEDSDGDVDEGLLQALYGDILDMDAGDDVFITDVDEIIRSRFKGDLWHDYHGLPMAKSCPVKAAMLVLVIHATTEFVDEDFQPVVEYVCQTLEIQDWRQHFRFNREWWRQRVRMLTPKAEEHAARIRVVHNLVKNDSAFKEYYSVELMEYFDKLERKALQGFYEELGDVNLFERVGTDRNGFALWIRKRGSVRCENVHQKMRVSIGP